MKGLFVLRLDDQAVVKSDLTPNRTKASTYHDLKWTGAGLWAGAEDSIIDRFEVKLT